METAIKNRICKLDESHARKNFTCGNEKLDIYLKQQASQDFKKGVAVPYVMLDGESSTVLGYYTLSSTNVMLAELPDYVIEKLPRYPLVPATLIGRLAIDNSYQGKGFGEILLVDGLRRALETGASVASYAAIVDAIDEKAVTFYEKYGFELLATDSLKLFLPMKTIAQLDF